MPYRIRNDYAEAMDLIRLLRSKNREPYLALLGSDLIVGWRNEPRAGIDRGTLKWLCDEFKASEKYRSLSIGTQRDYPIQR